MALYPTCAPKWGLCFDWETSGSDWNKDSSIDYQGISLGMAVFDTRTFDIVAEHYLEIKFDATKYKWSKEAEAIHGLTIEHLEQNGLTQEEAACEVVEFLLKYFGPNPNIMICGHNIPYDVKFMKQLLGQFELMFNIHHVMLDTAGAAFIAFTTYKSDHLFDLMCNGKRDEHNALEDVRMTLEAAKNLRALFEAALNG
jgi:oligoribonuclease (3'-5' exoribonuclease)